MSSDLTDHQVEILSRALQHGGVLAAPFGHPGEDSLVDEMEAHVADLETGGLVKAWRAEDHSLQRLEVTSKGYAALGVR
jgi:hypothetical protein